MRGEDKRRHPHEDQFITVRVRSPPSVHQPEEVWPTTGFSGNQLGNAFPGSPPPPLKMGGNPNRSVGMRCLRCSLAVNGGRENGVKYEPPATETHGGKIQRTHLHSST